MEISILIGMCDINERNIFINQVRNKLNAEIDIADQGIELCLKAFRNKPDAIVIDDEFIFKQGKTVLKKIMDECKYTSLVLIGDGMSDPVKEDYRKVADVFLTRPLRGREFIPNILVNTAQKKKLWEIENNMKKTEEELESSKHMRFAMHFIMDNLDMDEEKALEYMDKLEKNTGYDTAEIAEIIFKLFAIKKR